MRHPPPIKPLAPVIRTFMLVELKMLKYRRNRVDRSKIKIHDDVDSSFVYVYTSSRNIRK